MSLHGRLTYTEPESEQSRNGTNGRPPSPPPGMDEIKGERETSANGARVRLGDKIVLRPGTEGDVYDKILHGRTATVERIYRGYDERVYLGVTVDDDPGQDLLRETGRYLFFFADEVEPVPIMSEKRNYEPQMPDLASLEEPELPDMEKQILVAGVGNAWLGDDGFGGHVVRPPARDGRSAWGPGAGLRLGRPRPCLRGDARLPRDGARRRERAGWGAG